MDVGSAEKKTHTSGKKPSSTPTTNRIYKEGTGLDRGREEFVTVGNETGLLTHSGLMSPKNVSGRDLQRSMH